MINPTDQQIPTHRSKPSSPIHNERWERGRVKLRWSTTNNSLQPQPKHWTQPRPTTPLSTGHRQKKKKKKNHNHHSDPHQKPQPPLTHAVTHAHKKKKKKQPQRRKNGVCVWREERADGETEKEEREENWNNEMEEREISGEKVNKIYIYIYIF